MPSPKQPYGSIYIVTHRESGKFYIGQTRGLVSTRWAVHQSDAKLRPQTYFHKAIRCHGGEAFDVDVLATSPDPTELNRLETLWIIALGACTHGYNAAYGGDSYVRTPETLAKMAAAHRGKRLSDAHRQRLSEVGRGRKQSPEHVARRTAPLKGRTPSEACRRAVAEANKRRVLSDEARARLSAHAKRVNEVRWARA